MTEIALCSNCFKDQGLRLTAFNMGIDKNDLCPQCNTENGMFLFIQLFFGKKLFRIYFNSSIATILLFTKMSVYTAITI